MFKQFLLIVIASVAAIFLKSELVKVLGILISAHNQVAMFLANVFAGDSAGQLIRGVIALIVIPAGVGGVLALAWYLGKKTTMPYLYSFVWILWTILLTTLLAQAS